MVSTSNLVRTESLYRKPAHKKLRTKYRGRVVPMPTFRPNDLQRSQLPNRAALQRCFTLFMFSASNAIVFLLLGASAAAAGQVALAPWDDAYTRQLEVLERKVGEELPTVAADIRENIRWWTSDPRYTEVRRLVEASREGSRWEVRLERRRRTGRYWFVWALGGPDRVVVYWSDREYLRKEVCDPEAGERLAEFIDSQAWNFDLGGSFHATTSPAAFISLRSDTVQAQFLIGAPKIHRQFPPGTLESISDYEVPTEQQEEVFDQIVGLRGCSGDWVPGDTQPPRYRGNGAS